MTDQDNVPHDAEYEDRPRLRPDPENDRDARVAARSSEFDGGSPGNMVKILVGGLVGIIILILALMLIAPQQMASLFGGGRTSEAQDMQSTSSGDTGLSTEITERKTNLETDVPDTALPEGETAAPTGNSALADAERRRLAELETRLKAMEEGRGEITRDLLQQQADDLREQFERERQLAEEAYQRQLQDAIATQGMDGEADARQRLEEERARLNAINEAQVSSDLLVLDSSGQVTGGGASGAGERKLSTNEQFMASASTASYDTVRATQIAAPDRTIVQGTTLEAVLETAISTELPGVIRAAITNDVYSYDGSNVLLPRGTRLIGSYNSDVSIASNRAQLAWNRAITPDGRSVELGGYGADQLGMSGQTGFVDTRFGERFGSAFLISMLAITPQVVVDDSAGANTQELAEDVGEDLENTTQSVMNDYLSLPPVIYIDQGTTMTVFVNRDLVF
ncbi:TrbI/VirB10 family protein [Falsirhodobacter sp. 1013]|uniref:TrbI/VirB10 family protein n=1 Tax=Falsirhodobacter sp. 1013 TaxID=3417566 RepID=UPI003EBCDE3C